MFFCSFWIPPSFVIPLVNGVDLNGRSNTLDIYSRFFRFSNEKNLEGKSRKLLNPLFRDE